MLPILYILQRSVVNFLSEFLEIFIAQVNNLFNQKRQTVEKKEIFGKVTRYSLNYPPGFVIFACIFHDQGTAWHSSSHVIGTLR